jgi:SNF2 family DNA or RNA helicase
VKQLKSEHRLALTGTPLENRLLDLWSIVDFIQPGYLGNQEQFHETYEPRGEKPRRRKTESASASRANGFRPSCARCCCAG